MQIERRKSGALSCQHSELTPHNRPFSRRGQRPAAIELALSGELLEKLVEPAVAMDGTIIEQVGVTGDAWHTVEVSPP